MNLKIPRSPFSTPLSGAAKETELRLRNIFQWKKRRPPLPLLALMAAAVMLCGNLVSCQVREADTPVPPDSSAPPDASAPDEQPQEWTPVELAAGLLQNSGTTLDRPYEFLTEEEIALLQDLPAAELPREAVDLYDPYRGDFWEDILLPAAYDEAADVTVYLVFGGMPAGTYRDVPLQLESSKNLRADGIILRCGNRTAYFPLYWGGNVHFNSNPRLLTGDLDGDGQLEAALVLTMGWGTGVYAEDLYLFDLDTMTYTVPDYSEIPLELTASPDGSAVRLASGDQELEVEITQLGDRFHGQMEVGNIVRFRLEDGRVLCELDVDFTCDTLGYMARTRFPVVYEDSAYRLGPAELITDDMFAE